MIDTHTESINGDATALQRAGEWVPTLALVTLGISIFSNNALSSMTIPLLPSELEALGLVELLEEHSIKEAANLLGIKYENAKAIVRVYRREQRTVKKPGHRFNDHKKKQQQLQARAEGAEPDDDASSSNDVESQDSGDGG